MSGSTCIKVSGMLSRPGSRLGWDRSVEMGAIGVTSGRVVGPVRARLELDSLSGGIVVSGRVEIPWAGECRRCLGDVSGVEQVEVREVFEPHPTADDTYPLENNEIDVQPVLREAALLALPLAPLCSERCQGPAPEQFPTDGGGESEDFGAEPPRDPRWAALDDLRFDEAGPDAQSGTGGGRGRTVG